MSAAAGLIFDDIETELTIDVDQAAFYFDKLYISIECLGDRFPHGRIYSRQSGCCIGGWASLPLLKPDELANFVPNYTRWTSDVRYRNPTS